MPVKFAYGFTLHLLSPEPKPDLKPEVIPKAQNCIYGLPSPLFGK